MAIRVRDVKRVKSVFVLLKKVRKNLFFSIYQVAKHRKAGSPLGSADICLGPRSLRYLYYLEEYYTKL